jgi:predicted CxxxxCH...CXXCH cytochrome family protein
MKTLKHFVLVLAGSFLLGSAGASMAITLNYSGSWCGLSANPTRIACDSVDHLLYVSCPNSGKVVVLNSDGSISREITGLTRPGALTVDHHASLLVAEGGTVRRRSLDGTVLGVIGTEGGFVDPHDLVTTTDGRIYVTDADNRVKAFDANGSALFSWGGTGWFNGLMSAPVAISFDAVTGELAVCDQANYRIQMFDLSGDSLRKWGTLGTGTPASSRFLRPWGLDVDGQGRIWLYDSWQQMLQVFTTSGAFQFGCTLDRLEMRGGVDIAVDGNHLHITSPGTNCVEVYEINEDTGLSVGDNLHLTIQNDGEGDVTLRWRPIPLADGYRVYRSASPGFPVGGTDSLGAVSDTFYTDPLASGGDAWRFYAVTVVFNSLPCWVEYVPQSDTTEPAPWSDQNDPGTRAHDAPHEGEQGVNCSSCHSSSYAYPQPLPAWWSADVTCKSCHVATGMSAAVENHLGQDTVYCGACHNPHFQQRQYPHDYIDEVVQTPQGDRAVRFNNATDFIHGAPNYNGICEVCHTRTSHHRNSAAGDHQHNAGSNCLLCHDHEHGFLPNGGAGGACNSCHGAPPADATHLAHFGAGVELASYGTAENFSTATNYIFSCGTCHPSSSSNTHRDGHVEVELYDPNAPAGSLKSLNPATANYDSLSHTCSNVYCHSATTWTSGPVGEPLMENDRPVLDANGNLTYDPYTLDISRTYHDMTWGGSTPDCNGCHRNMPQTAYPQVDAGVGNSHAWIEEWGYEDLHAYNMASDPLTCRTCHYGTVTVPQGWSRDPWDVTTYGDVPIANKMRHVNGVKDVVFDSVNTVAVQEQTFSTAGASYDVATQTCSSLPCHGAQQTPQWGKPYRWWVTAECDQCHNMTGWFGPGRGGAKANHPPVGNARCTDCHTESMAHGRN